MKLAIVGYGQMGHIVDELAAAQGFNVVARISSRERDITEDSLHGATVAVEFTRPESAVENLSRLAALRVPVVTGTTGWFQHMEVVREQVQQHKSGLVWSANFSVGIAVFKKLVADAAHLLADEDAYAAWAWEIHHSAKKDAPSGTLLGLTAEMHKAGWSRPIDTASNRAGRHPGTHEIGFDTAADTITLRHTSRSREGFATGALRAARWIIGKQGVYTFEDVLFSPSP